MPKFEFTSPEGKQYEIEGPDGSTKEQAFDVLQTQLSGSKPQQPIPAKEGFGEQFNKAISSLPRQAGLTARYGLEGLADVAGIVTNPIAATANAMGANMPRLRDATSGVLDKIGLPSPNTPTERVVGDASRMLAGGGAMVCARDAAQSSLLCFFHA